MNLSCHHPRKFDNLFLSATGRVFHSYLSVQRIYRAQPDLHRSSKRNNPSPAPRIQGIKSAFLEYLSADASFFARRRQRATFWTSTVSSASQLSRILLRRYLSNGILGYTTATGGCIKREERSDREVGQYVTIWERHLQESSGDHRYRHHARQAAVFDDGQRMPPAKRATRINGAGRCRRVDDFTRLSM